ncbi:MAG: hypothetical protein ACOC2L_00205 [Candidatus Sumerlaeota bacterium]
MLLGINRILNWILWKGIVRYTAKSFGVLDPFTVLTKVRRFAKPSEVAEPGELLRAGVVFHARGLMNRAIQYNEDWVWPHWAERQFDAHDPAFIPRAFSLTHINLTHRNWTAVGLPGVKELPLVDPRGLVTPHLDSWSLDAWVVDDEGNRLLPSRCDEIDQSQSTEGNLSVRSRVEQSGMEVETVVSMTREGRWAMCHMTIKGRADHKAWLVVSLRPYNPEGISFVYDVELAEDKKSWKVDDDTVRFNRAPDRHVTSDYHKGDVGIRLLTNEEQKKEHCDVGMVTGAAMYELSANEDLEIEVTVPVEAVQEEDGAKSADEEWDEAFKNAGKLQIPDAKLDYLYKVALRTVLLHTQDKDVYPGPFMYKRFWFRDAAFILSAMIAVNMEERTHRVLDSFGSRQSATGYFLSQEGEWDSNGEALWIMGRYCDLTGQEPHPEWKKAIHKAAEWICRKRIKDKGSPHKGLFPAGFSAEHLGLNDFYYWDDFWGVAGLREAARMLEVMGEEEDARRYHKEADQFFATIEEHLQRDRERLGTSAMSAAPERRLDGGMIGNMVAGYPLALLSGDDERLAETAEYLYKHYCEDGAFLHHIGHSGYNAYLSLHIAQTFLRRGDERYWGLIQGVADRASQTGHWPEAIHPATGGGCMGDGQHVWAAAEWIMMMRNLFVLEEENDGVLVIGAGIRPEWLESGKPVSFGPARTVWGVVNVQAEKKENGTVVQCEGEWFDKAPKVIVRLPGHESTELKDGDSILVRKQEEA